MSWGQVHGVCHNCGQYTVMQRGAINRKLVTIVGDGAPIAAWESMMLDAFERLGEADQ